MRKAKLALTLIVTLIAPYSSAQTVHRAKVRIIVGPTVQVSKAFPRLTHGENLAAGDRRHPGQLLTCSMVSPPNDPYKGAFRSEQYCYASFDGGKSWEPTLKVTEGEQASDPAVMYGAGDDVYVTSMIIGEPDRPTDNDPEGPPRHDFTVVFRSTDGGHTWSESSRFGFIDRPYITVDTTSSRHAGRIYVVGQGFVNDSSGGTGAFAIKMWRSVDNGKTFLGPAVAANPQGFHPLSVGTGAVLSDGTLVEMFTLLKPGRKPDLEQEPTLESNAEIHVIASKDGGETFSKSTKAADCRVDRQRSEGGLVGQLAVDPGSEAFRDRIYVVYPEIVSDRIQIRFSYSSDKGKTWSKPVIVNDDRSPEKGGEGPDHLLPAVGVNKDGVVMVAWYDRREARDNLGWRVRAAVSLDGGETFSESVPVTEGANAYRPTTPWDLVSGGGGESIVVRFPSFFTSGGHTSGIAVDADGTFHPTWIDNRTGLAQLWSASIKVNGKALKHGAADLAQLNDISRSVGLQLSGVTFDRKTGNLSMMARLKNISKDSVEGSLKVRVLTLESEYGVPEITNADNGENGAGAVWDFSGLIPGGSLPSTKLSEPKVLTFRLTDLRAVRQGKDFHSRFFNVETRTYGKLQKEQQESDR